jgi:hypothetical protein
MLVTRIDRGEDLRQDRVGVLDGEVPTKPPLKYISIILSIIFVLANR